VADVDSLEKAEKRVAVKNLEGTQGYLQGDLLDQVLVSVTEGGGGLPFDEDGV
jgi:hypothetical protein